MLDFNQKLNLCKSKACKACGLYINQVPIFDIACNPQVFWVGLSAVQFGPGSKRLPLCSTTRSGNLIKQIETPFKGKLSFYKTNLVKCVPLKDGKIRYPSEMEMVKCYPNLEYELKVFKPSLVFLLGKQTASFVMNKVLGIDAMLPEDFNYKPITKNGITYISIHHPSYILVYKRQLINKYMEKVQSFCTLKSSQMGEYIRLYRY